MSTTREPWNRTLAKRSEVRNVWLGKGRDTCYDHQQKRREFPHERIPPVISHVRR